MGFLASIASTLFAGPAVGLFGSLISGVMGFFERKQQLEHDKAKWSHETTLQELNISARSQELESEDRIAQTAMIAETLKGSYEHDASYGKPSQGAANVLRFVRPLLAFTLLALVGWFWFSVPMMEVGDDLTLREAIVLKTLFLAEVAVTWFFADRRRANK